MNLLVPWLYVALCCLDVMDYLWCAKYTAWKATMLVKNGGVDYPAPGHKVYYACGMSYASEKVKLWVKLSHRGEARQTTIKESPVHQSQKVHSSPAIYSNAMYFDM